MGNGTVSIFGGKDGESASLCIMLQKTIDG